MRYQDYIDNMDSEKIRIHISSKRLLSQKVEKPVLMLSHNLSVTGAPIALLSMAKILMKNKCQVFIVSLLSGDILEEFLNIDAVVLICADRNIDMIWLKKSAELFPAVVINTLVLAPLVSWLAPVSKKLFWWIHESDYFFRELKYDNIPECSSLHILAASPKVSGLIHEHMGRSSDVLNVMVEDHDIKADRSQENRILHFLWTGFINANKMPELLLQAVLELPEDYRKRADFTFCGDGIDEARKNLLRECADAFPDIFYLSYLPHDQLMELMSGMDAVVVCSKEETTSLVAVEGLMLKKIVICSDGCGIADYLHDGENAFLFPAGKHDRLCRKIEQVIDHYHDFSEIGKKGRLVYERYYKEEIFEKRVWDLLGVSELAVVSQ